MIRAQWSAGLTAELVVDRRPDLGVSLRSAARGTVLGPELARSLAWWLLWAVGDRAGPAKPDPVRAAIDAQRAALAKRSTQDEISEDFRAGLAWAWHALDAVAAAANGETTTG